MGEVRFAHHIGEQLGQNGADVTGWRDFGVETGGSAGFHVGRDLRLERAIQVVYQVLLGIF